MASDQEHKEKLVAKYSNNEASEKELKAFFGLLGTNELDTILENDMDREIQSIRESLPVKRKTKLWTKIAGVAAVAFFALGIWFVSVKDQSSNNKATDIAGMHDIAPGKNKATLSLGNGNSIVLSEQKSGVVIDLAAGLAYNDGTKVNASIGGGADSKIKKQLAVTTPRGGAYEVVLPDGTRAWLNAATTLSFPENFKGESLRRVELIGEAYFEVSKDAKRPFVVVSNKQEVMVLGTHFNINSYPSESKIKTTLLEGSVKVIHESKDYFLKPGMQAQVGSKVDVGPADVEQTMAWMNGDFSFKDEDIKSIMRKLERWYDIDVDYEGEIVTINFVAEISREKTLKQVLKVLEETGGVSFKIEGRRVTVMQ